MFSGAYIGSRSINSIVLENFTQGSAHATDDYLSIDNVKIEYNTKLNHFQKTCSRLSSVVRLVFKR